MCIFSFNPYYVQEPEWAPPDFAFLEKKDMTEFHRSLEGYAPTPLIALPELADRLELKSVFVKDESHRFGIKAFKALGASYAIYHFIRKSWIDKFGTPFGPDSFFDSSRLRELGAFTFCAATDGNHGRAVAWTAKKLNQKAVIYMPADASPARVENIRGEDAEVVLVKGTFDDCVRRCAEDAEKNGWQAVSDTAYPGYMDLPKCIMLGYTTIFIEMEDSIHPESEPAVDVVFLQTGVGGLAAAGTSYYARRYGAKRPRLICVEPTDSDCFLESIRFGDGEPIPTRGAMQSIMVGLACGVPSPVAWPILKDGVNLFMSCPDRYAIEAMKLYRQNGIVSGESGASGLAGLLAMMWGTHTAEAREKLGLNAQARVLLINSEGDTDPVSYERITGSAS